MARRRVVLALGPDVAPDRPEFGLFGRNVAYSREHGREIDGDASGVC